MWKDPALFDLEKSGNHKSLKTKIVARLAAHQEHKEKSRVNYY